MIFKNDELNKFIVKRGVDEEINYHDFDNLDKEAKKVLLNILDEYYIRSTDYYEDGKESICEQMRFNDWGSIKLLAESLEVFTDKGYHKALSWFRDGVSYQGDAITYGELFIDIKNKHIDIDQFLNLK